MGYRDDISDQFDKVRANPEEVYKGREGYARMLSELRQSLYDQIPFAKGRIEIFDALADPDEELTRIAGVFNMTLEELYTNAGFDNLEEFKEEALNGHAVPIRLEDGGYFAVAAAWDPDDDINKAPEDMTFDDIHTYARINIHEIMHTLDPILITGEKPGEEGWIIGDLTNARALEMFADVGAQNLMLRNGDKAEYTNNLIVAYNHQAAYGAPLRSDFRQIRYAAYDNGPQMETLLKLHPGGNGLQSFYFQGWQDALDETLSMREQGPLAVTVNTTIPKYPQIFVFADIYRDTLDEIVAKLGPLEDKIMENTNAEDLKTFVDLMLDNMDFKGFKDGKYEHLSPEYKTALQSIYEGKERLATWMEEHAHIFPDAARVAAATRYLLGQRDNFSYEAPQNLTMDMTLARLWLKDQDQGTVSNRTFHQYEGLADIDEFHRIENGELPESFKTYDRDKIVELFAENPRLAEAIARGISVYDVVKLDAKDPDDWNDDEYSIVDNLEEIITEHNDTQTTPEPNTLKPSEYLDLFR